MNSTATALLIYGAIVLILALLSVFIMVSYTRYRFKDDKTGLFLALFATLFVVDVIASFLIISTSFSGG
ncbi:hypothetical protein KGQ71_04445 [Patescibacteria group bacterium]|nr:hypothetical protein [Patescibacteria group bacterium]